MTGTNVKASVLLPIYNAETYLRSAVDSVLNQTFEDFELLLLNDGSTDNSEAIIDDFITKDSRCRKLSWPNQGLIKTLNQGINESKGTVIFRMDADDICIPDRFAKQLAYLDKHPDVVAVGSRVLLIDSESLPIVEFAEKISHDDIDTAHFNGSGGAIVHPAAAIRKSALLEIGGYRDAYPHAEDLDLFLRLAEIGQLANMSEVLLHYRQHALSIGYAKRAEQLASARAAVGDAVLRRGLRDSIQAANLKDFKTPGLIDIYIKWGWWSLLGNNPKTARKYAFKSLITNPFKKEVWKLLVCSFRGY